MAKLDYEKLLKRIEKKLIKNSKVTDGRFELPPVDVMWEGQKTYLRNFAEYSKIMRRDSLNYYNIYQKNLRFLLKELVIVQCLLEKETLMILHGCLKFMSVITLDVLLVKVLIQE